MDENNNELNSLAKEINNSVYAKNRASEVAKEFGYTAANKTNKMVLEIREEMLAEGEEKNFVQTGVEKETSSSAFATAIDNDDENVIDILEDDADELIEEFSEDAEELGENARESINGLVQKGISTSVKGGVNTTVEEAEKVAEKGVGKLTKFQKVFGVATKVGAKGHKVAGKTAKFVRNNVPVADADGNIDSVGASTNQIKTVAKFAGRNAVGKPAKKVATKASKKVGKKIASKATTRLAKFEAKITAKLAKSSSKVVAKVAKLLIKLIINIIKLVIEAVCSCLPLAVVLLVVIIIIVVCLSVFGGGMDDSELKKYGDYMNTTQTEFQEKTIKYYEEGYKVDGTYNGLAIINWRAALSVLQALDPDIDGSDDAIGVLKRMKSDDTMYSIKEETTTKYVLDEQTKYASVTYKQTTINNNDTEEESLFGNWWNTTTETTTTDYTVSFKLDSDYEFDNLVVDGETVPNNQITHSGRNYTYKFSEDTDIARNIKAQYKEIKYTTKKYVVTVGTLDDYKEWVKSNTDYIKSYYNKRNISYDAETTNFLTDELIDAIDTLYNSEDFELMLDEAGVALSVDNITDGTIFDTGENRGVLAYPTTYRKLSADFPRYPSGREHTGIDFPCPPKTPVCSCADGNVVLARKLNYSYGYYVVIQHNINGKTLYTLYAHNSDLLVTDGQPVVKGQCIALSGSTGNSTGPHCHLSVLTSWSPQHYVDPKSYL